MQRMETGSSEQFIYSTNGALQRVMCMRWLGSQVGREAGNRAELYWRFCMGHHNLALEWWRDQVVKDSK